MTVFVVSKLDGYQQRWYLSMAYSGQESWVKDINAATKFDNEQLAHMAAMVRRASFDPITV